MNRSRLLLIVPLVVVLALVAAGAYETGRRMRPHSRIYEIQASLAFGHYKNYRIVADLLEQKCYDDALSFATYMRDLEKYVVAENLRRTGNDPTLLEYIRFRDAELLKSVLAGHAPAPQPITTRCVPHSYSNSPRNSSGTN
jgi:hypothetical protein